MACWIAATYERRWDGRRYPKRYWRRSGRAPGAAGPDAECCLPSGIQALTQIANNPNFSNDPEAVKDITSTAMQMSRVLTGQTDQVPGKGGKMQKQDPWAFVESRLNNAVSQHYGGQPAQERPAPAELPGGIPLPGSDAAAGGQRPFRLLNRTG